MGKQVPNVTDERLCWLAVRDYVDKKSRRTGPLGVLFMVLAASGGTGGPNGSTVGGPAGAGLAGDLRRDKASSRKARYALAVDIAPDTLSADERRHLRATGEVPAWFLPDVERRVAELKKQRPKR
ncbi:hypothetical protein [Streptantibioticus cattleyicolor]|uniref:Uncharacterized protein n=1 Tax=Streptantibioticus cattleyicolor (strain ATCC 35852 / DSM 46488 / JCM 4925 / NBRC 14057 / NRRL 8057) TaxID=1003195 RepID=F8JLK4_STREN|nr:hypothetical protein [Streptantibioticus cattleyicolor]AEW98276.1 hypothetical protein SCATT_p00830 [Streptantibioticus cattleyicolor NRRL 8057 = DSM 46488]CCB72663.1 protein of unknown function [Streptantibioticus cattleyicolor NRRL 8057 = DSM 46488]